MPELLTLALCAVALAACGSEDNEPAREGLDVTVNGVRYNAPLSRQLNPMIVPDRAYYEHPPPPPAAIHFGVFLKACNEKGRRRRSVAGFKVVDSQDNSYRPITLPETNPFAYDAEVLAPEECIPEEGSIADLGPTAGAMLLFELPLAALENRPLLLHIGTSQPVREQGHIELDL